MTAEEEELWAHASALWALSQAREAAPVRETLHPDYMGWVTGQDRLHDREAAVASVGLDSPRVLDYTLHPLSVKVYDGRVGVVHYRYEAQVETGANTSKRIAGRWSEVYLRRDGAWIMVSVSGGPDGQR